MNPDPGASPFEQELRLRLARHLEGDVASVLDRMVGELEHFKAQQVGRQAVLNEVALFQKWAVQALDSIRRLRNELRGSEGLDPDFVPGLLQEIRSNPRSQGSLQVSVSVARNWPSPIYTTAAKALRRIVLEAVQNARLHGGANRVRITLRVRDDGQAVLTVGDDGRGLSSGWLRGSRGFGVIGMRERAHMLGGRLEITRRRTRGTLVRVTLPMAQLAPA